MYVVYYRGETGTGLLRAPPHAGRTGVANRISHTGTPSRPTIIYSSVPTPAGCMLLVFMDILPSHEMLLPTQTRSKCSNRYRIRGASIVNARSLTHTWMVFDFVARKRYEQLLGIRQPDNSYGFEQLELAPPLISSLPAMAGTVTTVHNPGLLEISHSLTTSA
jgi:hypothetical protein